MEMGQNYLLDINHIVDFDEIIRRNKVELGLFEQNLDEVKIDRMPRMKLHAVELTYFMITNDNRLCQKME